MIFKGNMTKLNATFIFLKKVMTRRREVHRKKQTGNQCGI